MTVTTSKIVIAVGALGVLIAAFVAYQGYKYNYFRSEQAVIPCGNHGALPGAPVPQSATSPTALTTATHLRPC
jgi:hypothetical protein